jgi:CRP-like cAMP-binding protein
MTASFFDYPDSEDKRESQELVFLPHWDEPRWQKLLSYCEVRSFHSGDMVISPGEVGRDFYIILDGQLEVLIPRGDGTWRSTQVREAGTVIGEQSFLDGRPRSAALRALSAGKLLSISQDTFQSLAAREPELARDMLTELGRTLSLKLRQANSLIGKWMK